MNDVYTYPDYTEYDETMPKLVDSEKSRLLGRLAAGSVSYLELMCLPSEGAPLQSREIIDLALGELERDGQIHKVSEVTSNQNAVVGYELTTRRHIHS